MLSLLAVLLLMLKLVLLLYHLLLYMAVLLKLTLRTSVLLLLMRRGDATEALVRVKICELVQAAMKVVIAHVTWHIMSVIAL